MYLQKIEIYGFKSFAEKTTIEFKDGITAIVGPNGSGKSNIVDAFRWVLGEQSMKSLRGESSSDIIFGGTDFRKRLGFAEVSIYFSNEDGFFNIDFKEIKITRKLYRSGESEYLINDSRVKLKEISELLMGTGIGRDGYSIIGQGKIDKILSSNMNDRKRIFEEAAGIMKYKYRKSEAVKSLESADINLIRIRDILSEINLNIDSLEEKSKKAKEYINLSAKLKDISSKFFFKRLEEINNKKDNYNNINDSYNETLKSLSTQMEKIKLERDKIEISQNDIKEEISILTNTSSKKMEERNNLEKSILIKENNAKQKEDDIKRLKEEIINLEKEISCSSLEYDDKYNKYLKFKEEADDFEKKYLEKKNILDEKTLLLSENEKKIISFKDKIDKNIDSIYSLKNEISIKETEKDIFSRELSRNINIKNEYISRLDSKNVEMQEFNKSNLNILKKKEEENKKLEILNEKIENSKKKIEEYSTKKKEIIAINSGLNARLNVLELVEGQNENYSFSVKEILKNKDFKNTVKGVVANIIEVDSKYAVAIETALGYSLQNIVVETKEDAGEIISYLKKSNIGRATFLPINNLKYSSNNDKHIKSEGIIGFASGIVKYKKEYYPVIQHLLGKTVIANDMKSAINFSKTIGSNFKIVTLDGDIINPSGQMTGGSRTKTKSGLLSNKEDIKRISSEINKNEKNILDINKNLSNEEANLENLKNLRKKYYDVFNKFSVEYAIYEEKKSKLDYDIISLKDSVEKTKNTIKELEEKIVSNKEIIDKSEFEIKEKEDENKNIEAILKIEENTKEKEELNNLKDEVTDLKISYSSFKDSVSSSLEIAER